MKVLIDTNVLIDFLANRQPFYDNAEKIMDMCIEGKIDGYLAAHSITNTFYIMRKVPVNDLRKMLKKVLSFLSVVGIDYERLIDAVNDLRFDDIEDCLQSVCAQSCGAECIITRNLEDFKGSEIAAISPSDFLSNYKL